MIRLVLLKELLDHWRDRRSVGASLILPVMGPLVLLLTLRLVADLQKDKPLQLPVVGAEHAPRLIEHLESGGVEILPPPKHPERAVVDGDADMVLLLEAAYADQFRDGESARAQLLIDDSRRESQKSVRRMERLLLSYSQTLGALRLLMRGVSPELAVPVAVETIDLSTPEKLATQLMSMIPMFLMLAAMVGGMNLAIDTTAGERERGSLEPLLLNPVPRFRLVVGKWLATSLASVAIAVVTQLAFATTLSFVALEDLGMKLSLGWAQSLQMLAAVLPLAFFGASLQMVVATFARSFKEAQTYLNLLNLVPLVPSMFLMFQPTQSSAWMMMVPALAQMASVIDVMRGDGVSGWYLGLIWLSSSAYSAMCLSLLVRLLGNERIIFGRA